MGLSFVQTPPRHASSQAVEACTHLTRAARARCPADAASNALTGVNRVIVPFLACGDLSAFDSDMTYPSEGQSLDPVQAPINPPYKKVGAASCPPAAPRRTWSAARPVASPQYPLFPFGVWPRRWH